MDPPNLFCWDASARQQFEKGKKILHKRIAHINARLNATAPISRLPPELLSEIFIDARDDWSPGSFRSGWVRLTHVCHWWRHIALGTPRLWSCIDVSSVADNVGRTKAFLERSKASPLTVNVRSPAVSATRAIFQEGHRIQHLSMSAFDMTYEDLEFPDTAPVLKSISLDAIEEVSLDVPRPFNTCQYPALTNLRLYCFKIGPLSTLWAGTLTTLDLCYCHMSFGELFAILERTPLLRYLKLTGEVDPPGSELTPPTNSSIDLPQLKSLTWHMTEDISEPTQVLNRIRVPASCDLDIAISGGPSVTVPEARAFWSSRVFSESCIGAMKEFRSCFVCSKWGQVVLAFERDLHERMIIGDARFQIAIHPLMMEPMNFFREFFTRHSVVNVEFLSVDNSRNWYRHGHPEHWALILSALPNLKMLELVENSFPPTPAINDILYCLDPLKGKDVKVTLPGGDSTTFIAPYLDKLVLEGRLSFRTQNRNWDSKGEMETLVELLRNRKECGIPINCLHVRRSGVINEEWEELRSMAPDIQISN